jgi:RyR and IP3R Homology associated
MLNTIEMLIELTQGPCKENQDTLLEGEFLELCNKILSDVNKIRTN